MARQQVPRLPYQRKITLRSIGTSRMPSMQPCSFSWLNERFRPSSDELCDKAPTEGRRTAAARQSPAPSARAPRAVDVSASSAVDAHGREHLLGAELLQVSQLAGSYAWANVLPARSAPPGRLAPGQRPCQLARHYDTPFHRGAASSENSSEIELVTSPRTSPRARAPAPAHACTCRSPCAGHDSP